MPSSEEMSGTAGSMGETATVRISRSLADRISKRLSKTDFKSVDEYVNYVVEQVLADLEGEAPTQGTDENAYSKEDQATVEQRLRDLGYL